MCHNSGWVLDVFPLRSGRRRALLPVVRSNLFPTNLCQSESRSLKCIVIKIVERAGLNAWPKPFQNLRSTRQTELEERFPSHVVCAWLGNSIQIARKHYLQVTDEHFKKALQNPMHGALQNIVQQRNAGERNRAHEEGEGPGEPAICAPMRSVASSCVPEGAEVAVHYG